MFIRAGSAALNYSTCHTLRSPNQANVEGNTGDHEPVDETPVEEQAGENEPRNTHTPCAASIQLELR